MMLRHSPTAARRREGYTIIEMMSVLTCLMVIGLMATQILHQLAFVGRQTAQANRQIAAVDKLARDLRRDLANSTSVDEITQVVMTLRSGDQVIQYSTDRSSESQRWRIKRVANRDGSVVAREIYELPDRCEPRFLKLSDDAMRIDLTGGSDGVRWIIEGMLP